MTVRAWLTGPMSEDAKRAWHAVLTAGFLSTAGLLWVIVYAMSIVVWAPVMGGVTDAWQPPGPGGIAAAWTGGVVLGMITLALSVLAAHEVVSDIRHLRAMPRTARPSGDGV